MEKKSIIVGNGPSRILLDNIIKQYIKDNHNVYVCNYGYLDYQDAKAVFAIDDLMVKHLRSLNNFIPLDNIYHYEFTTGRRNNTAFSVAEWLCDNKVKEIEFFGIDFMLLSSDNVFSNLYSYKPDQETNYNRFIYLLNLAKKYDSVNFVFVYKFVNETNNYFIQIPKEIQNIKLKLMS